MKIPTFVALMLIAGPAMAQETGAPLQNNMRDLSGPTLSLDLEAAQAALDACKASKVAVGVTVTDEAGGLRVVLGSDGAVAADANGSRRSATVSAAMKQSGVEIGERMKADKAFADKVNANPDWLVRDGSLLIKSGDKIVGVIAVEGHPHDSKRDIACAQAGIDKIQSRLK